MLAFLHCTLPTPLLFQDTAIWKFWNTSACTSKESWFTGWLCHHLPRILHQCSLSWIDPHSHWQLTSLCVLCLVAQLYLTLCDPMDCNLRGSSVHRILQAKILEWVAIPFSRGSSEPRDGTCVSYVSCPDRQVLHHLCHLRSPDQGSNLCPCRGSQES